MKTFVLGMTLLFSTISYAEKNVGWSVIWMGDVMADGQPLRVHHTSEAIDACHNLSPSAELPSISDYKEAVAHGVFEKRPLEQQTVGYMTTDTYNTHHYIDQGDTYKPEIYGAKYRLFHGMTVVVPALLKDDSVGAYSQTDNDESGYMVRCLRKKNTL